ncbi:aspartate kinase [Hymenobacter busanensis]|uniref:Aspartokinase n=1 Tax=Hymenobacter busanensis TaxID=2607656 RepID=A0A7L4ZVB5_9BACT|nr:aspartate kinase [Hymenobacter busanensis]KAA9339281.1 aspartate kinase [Hymenobacter busanensis]QHJ06957.1 aspartate kinase [Hymenobacter busanensis]
MKVLKFGGTSVGTAERMRAVATLIQAPAGQQRIVVLSAMSGTTNALVNIAKLLFEGDLTAGTLQIEVLRQHYHIVARELLPNEEALAEGLKLVDDSFKSIFNLTRQPLSVAGEKVILAQGELLSTRLFHLYLTRIRQEQAVLLPALDFMRLDHDEEPDAGYIREHLAAQLALYPEVELFITQGYICRNAQGSIDNLKRGGSDYSASLIGAAAQAEEIQIWTDIDGLHNNDPRVVEGTYPIRELSFDEAAELAYFGAKILHPSSVLPAREHGIPVRLLNTMQPEAPGTLISAHTGQEAIKAVAAKDGLTAIKVKSSRMLLAHGFLRAIFEVFERHRTSIDMITTSEVAVSLTIDDAAHLPEIVAELQRFGSVEVDENQTIICLVGNLIQDAHGAASQVFEALHNIPLRMISYGGSPNNISLLINTPDKTRALKALNAGLFARPAVV